LHTKSYPEHLREAQYCSLQWRLLRLKDDGDQLNNSALTRFRVVPVRCNSKACPRCAKLHFQKLRRKLNDASINTTWRFFTLTSFNSNKPCQEKLLEVEDHFRELRKKLKRKYPEFKYIAVKELSPSGMWHYHGLWNVYIDIKTLSSYWQEISGAYRVHLEAVRNPKGAVNYIFKYCFKSIHNESERRTLYECDKKKFTTSRGLLSKNIDSNPYTCDLGTQYNTSEIKEELYNIIANSDFNVDDFSAVNYPYFEDLIFNIFHDIYCNSPPDLFLESRLTKCEQ
jgi:hypothetical protein